MSLAVSQAGTRSGGDGSLGDRDRFWDDSLHPPVAHLGCQVQDEGRHAIGGS